MIKAELSYNPYLLETAVRFNGQAPRINSLIEKYQNGKLQEWTDVLPLVFHDEMNGYDFELDFSGTKADFDMVKKAFADAGVSEKSVEFFYKNELEDPITKKNRINELIGWLVSNRNRKFDFEAFRDRNAELFDAPCSVIAVNGGNASAVVIAGEKVPVENISDIDELSSTDLSNTPIVMFIESADNVRERKNLRSIIRRGDISGRQVFFCIKHTLNRAQTERTISDMGIANTNIVSGLDDKMIADYFEAYPLTCHIKNFLDAFRRETIAIQDILNVESEKSRIANSAVHKKIEALEESIRLLKYADELFMQKDNLQVPPDFHNASVELLSAVICWRKKKTKTTDPAEAERMAQEYDAELAKLYAQFVEKVDNAGIKMSEIIDEQFSSWFADTKAEPGYNPTIDFVYEAEQLILPSLYQTFLQMKTEQYTEYKGSFMDVLKMDVLKGYTGSGEKVLETAYTYEDWRMKAAEVIEPMCSRAINSWTYALSNYYSRLAEVYRKHIQELIGERTALRNQASEQLSDDERLLQSDSDWLAELKDKLHLIERG